MVHIRRADQRDALPGKDEDRTLIPGVQKADGLCHGQLPRRKDEMASPQRAYTRLTAYLLPQPVRPGAGGVDHNLCPYGNPPALRVCRIGQSRPDDVPALIA